MINNSKEYWTVNFILVDKVATFLVEAHSAAEASRAARDELYSKVKNQRYFHVVVNGEEMYREPNQCVVARSTEQHGISF